MRCYIREQKYNYAVITLKLTSFLFYETVKKVRNKKRCPSSEVQEALNERNSINIQQKS